MDLLIRFCYRSMLLFFVVCSLLHTVACSRQETKKDAKKEIPVSEESLPETSDGSASDTEDHIPVNVNHPDERMTELPYASLPVPGEIPGIADIILQPGPKPDILPRPDTDQSLCKPLLQVAGKSEGLSCSGQIRAIFSRLDVSSASGARPIPVRGAGLFLNKRGNLFFADSAGNTYPFSEENGKFGEQISHQEALDYDLFYNLLSDGWAGFLPADFWYLASGASGVSHSAVPEKLSGFELKGLASGSVFMKHRTENQYYVLRYANDRVSYTEIHSEGKKLLQISDCQEGCVFWAFDGKNLLYTTKDSARWESLTTDLVIPEGVNIVYMAGPISLKENAVLEDSRIFAMDEKGYVWQIMLHEIEASPVILPKAIVPQPSAPEPSPAPQPVPAEPAVEWDSVLAVAREACIPCHSSERFDDPNVWRSMKDEIIRRVRAESRSESFAMPVPNTPFSRDFTDKKRETILDWLHSQ